MNDSVWDYWECLSCGRITPEGLWGYIYQGGDIYYECPNCGQLHNDSGGMIEKKEGIMFTYFWSRVFNKYILAYAYITNN